MPRLAIHPGIQLAEQLEVPDMGAAALTRQIEAPTNRIMHIPNGRGAITGDTALRPRHLFDARTGFWRNLQTIYEQRVAEQESSVAIKNLSQLRDRAH